MSDKVIDVPKGLNSYDSFRFFQNELYGYPEWNKYNEIEKLKIKSAIKGKEYHRISSSLWVVEFMDIPSELIKSIEFVSEYNLEITFYESEEFCIEKYFQLNFDVLKNKILQIKYLDSEGYCIRHDSYTISKIGEIKKDTLSNEISNLTIKIIFECKKHDISTCKE